MSRPIILFLIVLPWVFVPISFSQPPQSDALKQRIQKELEGKKAAEAAEPPVAEQAAALTKQLDSADEKVRDDAVSKLRLLARRVDRFGGQREQRGEVFEPKVPGLLPLFIKAAHDKAEYVRFAATYALADTLDPAALPTLREMLNDPSRKVRVSAACLLTEFHDASGLPELKKAVLLYARRIMTSTATWMEKKCWHRWRELPAKASARFR